MTEKKKTPAKSGARKKSTKSPILVSELMKKEAAKPRSSTTKTPAPQPDAAASSAAPDGTSADVYQFVSDGYQSLTRSVTDFRDAFKKDPMHALQDLQIRTLAFLSKKLPSRKANPDAKDDYRRMRREWIKRRVMQSKPARAIKSRLKKT